MVELHDIGYRVFVPLSLYERYVVGESVALSTHEVIRDDRRELFGMPSPEHLALFHQLITVSGVGPKIALGILSIGEPREIRAAIAREDAPYLSKVVGIGRKTAERVVVELKGKMAVEVASGLVGAPTSTMENDVFDALTSLGYKLQEVRDVIRQLPVGASTTEEKLKVALRALAKR